jgi:hypothetical protein
MRPRRLPATPEVDAERDLTATRREFLALPTVKIHPLRVMLLQRGFGRRGEGGRTLEEAAEMLGIGDVKTLKNVIAWRWQLSPKMAESIASEFELETEELFPPIPPEIRRENWNRRPKGSAAASGFAERWAAEQQH